MDTLLELKELALATRLKRLSEILSKDVSLIYKTLEVDFKARWFTFFTLLVKKSPRNITEIANVLGISHTAVHQIARELLKKGYIISEQDIEDERQRLLSISPYGKKIESKLKPVWEKIKQANKELLDKASVNLLLVIDEIEEELKRESMYDKISLLLNGKMNNSVKILDYSPKLKKHYYRLNSEWLNEYFSVEPDDEKFMKNPKRYIINRGGYILFAEKNDRIVGTVSIIKHLEGIYEIAKMTVTKSYRGQGIGKQLLTTAIERIKNEGVNETFLLTSEKLKTANIIYKSFGFKKIDNVPFGGFNYKRKTFAMKCNLS